MQNFGITKLLYMVRKYRRYTPILLMLEDRHCDIMQKNVLIGLCAVVVVAVVVIAGLAVVLNNDKDDKLPDYQADTGTVYGNADGDCYIDSTDRKIIKKIIDGDAELKDYPFADANNDGSVNEADLEIVDKYIAGESCTLKVLDAENKVINVAYPISTVIVLCGSNLAPLINILDISDKIVGAAYTGEKINAIRDYPIKQGIDNGTITKISTKGTSADLELVKKLVTDKGCHFMMTEYSSMYDLDSDENVVNLNAMSIDVVRMEARDPGQDLRSMAVFGILLGKSAQAESYQEFMKDVYSQIDSAIGDKKGTHKVLITSTSKNISGLSSGYTAMIEKAGGVNAADWQDSTKSLTKGDTWHLDPKYSVDMIFVGSTSDYAGSGFKDSDVTNIHSFFDNHNAMKNGKVYQYSTGIPVVCRIAYYAQSMYPDSFEDGWAHGIHQSFVDTFFKTKYTVDDSLYFVQVAAPTS